MASTRVIGDKSCKGKESCENNVNTIGDQSCRGVQSCTANSGRIQDGSCFGKLSCENNRAPIGNNWVGGMTSNNRTVMHGSVCFLLFFLTHLHFTFVSMQCVWSLTGDEDEFGVCENNREPVGANSCRGYMACCKCYSCRHESMPTCSLLLSLHRQFVSLPFVYCQTITLEQLGIIRAMALTPALTVLPVSVC